MRLDVLYHTSQKAGTGFTVNQFKLIGAWTALEHPLS